MGLGVPESILFVGGHRTVAGENVLVGAVSAKQIHPTRDELHRPRPHSDVSCELIKNSG